MQYKHYSFDLWMTLIKSHPEYKKRRTKYFFDHFNRAGKTIEQVDSIIREVEKMTDHTNQLTGLNLHCIEIISMILFRLQYDCENLKQDDVIAIMHLMQQQFQDCPAILFSSETIPTIKRISDSGASLSILSNTGFIVGETLLPILEDIGILQYFSFVTFSDIVHVSKPNPEIFKLMTNTAFLHNGVARRQILHVGDNFIADIQGANIAGIKSFQINSNNQTIKDVL